MTMKRNKQIKARRMWANGRRSLRNRYGFSCVPYNRRIPSDIPVAVIDISDPGALVKQAHTALTRERWGCVPSELLPKSREMSLAQASAVLTSLGILPAKKGSK